MGFLDMFKRREEEPDNSALHSMKSSIKNAHTYISKFLDGTKEFQAARRHEEQYNNIKQRLVEMKIFLVEANTLVDKKIKNDITYQSDRLKNTEQLKKAISKNDVAAFIFEPLVQGAGGMIMYEPEPLNEILKICKAAEVLTIADEVMTGFGRTGKFFATDYISEKPDIMCLSKGLTGGTMAMGITTCTENIYNAFLSDDKTKTLFHGHSYTANPVACTAAIASLDLLEKNECWEKIKMIEEKHKSFYLKIKNNSKIKNIRQTGTIIAFELKTSESTSYINSLRDKVYDFFIDKGIILRPLGNIIYILPPYCISSEDLDFFYDSIEECLNII